jgi:hypothetical protein
LPIIVLPVAYALTFETLTLSSEDLDECVIANRWLDRIIPDRSLSSGE